VHWDGGWGFFVGVCAGGIRIVEVREVLGRNGLEEFGGRYGGVDKSVAPLSFLTAWSLR
jgi:hypothetical protein